MNKYLLPFSMLLASNVGFTQVREEAAQQSLKTIQDQILSENFKAAKNAALANVDSSLCNYDEDQFRVIENQVISQFKNYLLGKEVNLSNFLAAKIKATGIPFKTSSLLNNFADENMKEFKLDNQAVYTGLDRMNKEFKASLGVASKVESVSLETSNFNVSKSARNKDGFSFHQAQLVVRFSVRLKDKDKNKIDNRGKMRLQVDKDANGNWLISEMALLEGTSLVAKDTLRFENVSDVALGDQVPTYLRREAIRRGGYATAMGDFNHDGNVDMFVASAGTTVLLKGDGTGKFTTVKNSGLENHTLVKSAAFVDLYNSGNQDLVLIRFTPHENPKTPDERTDIVIYKNVGGGKFKKLDLPIRYKNNHPYAMPMAIADFNQDGYLDLYVGFPGARDFTTMKEKVVGDEKDLRSYGFFFNRAPAQEVFVEQAAENIWYSYDSEKVQQFYKSQGRFFPHSAVAVDFNLDGYMDVVAIDDRNQLSPLYQGMPEGKFKQSNESFNVSVHDLGMSAAFGDLFNTGKIDFLMSSVNFAANERMVNSCIENWDLPDFVKAGAVGLRVFKNEGAYYSEVSKSFGLDFAGYGLAGVELVDYNNDGNLDIYVSNGLWSGSEDNSQLEISSMVNRAANMGLFEDSLKTKDKKDPALTKVAGQMTPDSLSWLNFNLESQSAVMDVLSYAKDKDGKQFSYAGYQRKRLFRNNGNNTFTEVGYALGLDSVADGYMVAMADLNNDGRMDIVARNADPGVSASQFKPVEIYLNKMKNKKSIIMHLTGLNKSGSDAIGSVVRMKVGNKKILRVLTSMNGTVQSEKLIHIGLDNANYASHVEITWPDGQVQKIDKMKAGIYRLKQPNNLKTASNKE